MLILFWEIETIVNNKKQKGKRFLWERIKNIKSFKSFDPLQYEARDI